MKTVNVYKERCVRRRGAVCHSSYICTSFHLFGQFEVIYRLRPYSATHMLDPGLGPAFPCPAPKFPNSAVVGSSPAANMS